MGDVLLGILAIEDAMIFLTPSNINTINNDVFGEYKGNVDANKTVRAVYGSM